MKNIEIQPAYVCPMLWRGLSVGTLGEVRPCCFWPEIGNLHKSKLEEIWNSEEMKEKRKLMLAGEKLPECQICFDQEARGQGSSRLAYIEECKNRGIELIGPVEVNLDPRVVDLRFSNLCNLKCRTCWAGASSRWQSELGLEEGLKVVTSEQRGNLQYLIQNNLDNIVEIYFAGGEPTIIEEDWEILKSCVLLRKTNIHLRYSTNLMRLIYKNQNIVDWWERWLKAGGKLQLGLSVDGIGSVVEFIRTGVDWKVLDRNIREVVTRLGKYENCLIEFSPVVSTLNVLHIPNLIRYSVDCGLSPWQVVNHNFLQHPLCLSVRNLTDRAKTVVDSKLREFWEIENKGEIKDRIGWYRDTVSAYMHQVPVERDNLLATEYTDHYTQVFNILNPELTNWWLELPQFKENGEINK